MSEVNTFFERRNRVYYTPYEFLVFIVCILFLATGCGKDDEASSSASNLRSPGAQYNTSASSTPTKNSGNVYGSPGGQSNSDISNESLQEGLDKALDSSPDIIAALKTLQDTQSLSGGNEALQPLIQVLVQLLQKADAASASRLADDLQRISAQIKLMKADRDKGRILGFFRAIGQMIFNFIVNALTSQGIHLKRGQSQARGH